MEFMWGMVALGMIGITGFAFWLFKWMFSESVERREDLERRIEIESGVIKSNAKADNATDDSDLNKRVQRKFADRSR